VTSVASDDATVTVVQRSDASVETLAVRVVGGDDDGANASVRLDRAISVGSSQDNDLRISDRTVSRYHLELRPAPGGVLVTDLGSLNGTHYAGARIDKAILPLGAELSVGETTLRIESARAKPVVDDPEPPALPGLIAVSTSMRRIVATIGKLAPTMVSVLIEGETGTGKEVVASAIHAHSPRAIKPFVAVDCGALPPNLIASELFGHERGAFTGANRRHLGAFERATGGTLLLDEIGELPLELQPVLLGVLERRRFRRVGGEQELPVDVRVLSATNRDLRAWANTGRFRSDLYFRLAVSRIVIPPLRERPDDIAPLILHFAEQMCGHARPEGLSDELISSLSAQHWTGNVRELRNFIENAIALGFESVEAGAPRPEPSEIVAYRRARAEALAAFEQSYLTELMTAASGNASEASRRAQMDRAYLLSLLRRHGLR
jgi:DNA-binding NtrC family response regulator